jgi:predicted metal-dependent hydrolase
VLDEVAGFVKQRRGKTPAISEFIRQHRACLKEPKPRKVTAKTIGKYHNLTDVFNSLNGEHFNNNLSVLLTWGQRNPRYAVRRRTLGSYQKDTNTIRINPILDNRKVPRYVLEFIVYHEMLHAAIDMELKNGRRRIHSKEFKERERMFKHYHKAIAWEKQKLR